MLRPHSLLWHYLWVGPHVLQLILAIILWRRGFHKQFPFFFTYLVFVGIDGVILWVLDWLPSVSAVAYWQTDYAEAVLEGLLTLAVVWEIFSHLVRPYPARARSGKRLIMLTGAVLVPLAVLATHNPVAPTALIGHLYSLLLGLYTVLSGLMLFLFLFSTYHRLTWDRLVLGVALGFSIDWCEHAAGCALIASGIRDPRLDLLSMATYHVCVLIWYYYLLSPARPSTDSIDNKISPRRKTDGPIGRIGQRLQPSRLPARL
jgi:hypothetical protein